MTVKLYCDGGTRGSRICMHDPQFNKTIIKQRGTSKKLSNNELEYLALLYTLSYANNKYPKNNIVIHTDSLLVANQMNGKWRLTTEHLIPLHLKCSKLMRETIEIAWIKRSKNLAGHVLEK